MNRTPTLLFFDIGKVSANANLSVNLFDNSRRRYIFCLLTTTLVLPSADDKSPASAADSSAGTGKSARAVSRLLHTVHRLSPGQDAVREPAPS